MSSVKWLGVAILAGLLLVPAAGAGRAPRVKLALVPLPRSVLGAAGASLALANDSGPVSNADAAALATDIYTGPGYYKGLGRLNGYVLEYGDAFTGAVGITDIRTGIEQYKTRADARRAMGIRKWEDARLRKLNNPAFPVTGGPVKVPVPARRTSHFAYLTSYSASNIAPLSRIDEQVLDGRYILDVNVTAGTASTAQALAPTLAKKLDARFRLERKGRLHARPVRLPTRKAGPPPGEPNLSGLALGQSDFNGKVTVKKGYVIDPAAVSDYVVVMLMPGVKRFCCLEQDIEWFPSANQAGFYADFENAMWLRDDRYATPLDLSGLGDGAQGSISYGPLTEAGNWSQMFFSTGQLAEGIWVGGTIGMSDTDVTKVAKAAANRIDAAGLGSG